MRIDAKSSQKADRASGPQPVDGHVGRRIRERRVLSGITQEKLGVAIGLTFQQVQKYERGANRVSASRLYDLARVLEVPVSYFFDGFAGRATPIDASSGPERFDEEELKLRRETLEFVRVCRRISDRKVRRRLFDLAKSLADVEAAKP